MSEDPTLIAILGGPDSPAAMPDFGPSEDEEKGEAERAAMRNLKRLFRSDDSGEDEMRSAFRNAISIFKKG